MASWLEKIVQEKIEKMVVARADELIEQHLAKALSTALSETFQKEVGETLTKALNSNIKSSKALIAEISSIDSALIAYTKRTKEKIQTQLDKALDGINIEITITKEHNAAFSNKIANQVLGIITNNPSFIIGIIKQKLTDHLSKLNLFGTKE